MGKIKWLLLFILVVFVVITIILFVDFINDRKKLYIDEGHELSDIYKVKLYRNLYQVYESDKLIYDVASVENANYIVFDDTMIKCCTSEDICNGSNYVYDKENNTIILEENIMFLAKGTYKIEILEDDVQLVLEYDNRKTIYYFSRPKG